MRDPLSQAIAKQLADSNVGLFRKQLFDKIPADLTAGNIEKVSQTLNVMLNESHVEKSARQGVDGSRWSLTPKGRAAYSALNDDEQDDRGYTNRLLSDAMAAPADELHGADLSPEQVDKKLAELSEGIDDERDYTFPEHLQHPDSFSDLTLEFLDSQKITKTFLQFDVTDTLDRALYGLVKLIRDTAEQPPVAIERKTEKLVLLERLENNDLFPGNVRALLSYIRRDIEQLDEA
ncbi:hypothetical protein [Methylomonas sp. HYX-M1]|uniref:hypothetical protein n=1 Tax=Methylomonas sp. HYX-M1 TaxID=3139307 RepID=UPI00345BA091